MPMNHEIAPGIAYEREAERIRLIEALEEEFRQTAALTGITALSPRLRAALARIPRHRFVPEAEQPFAYANQPLPIGRGQTISQPFIVALMTALLHPEPTERILEVGTGCGYQTAVLAELAARVYTIERIPELARAARARLGNLGYNNIECRTGDGRAGWPEAAPFDGILVTAAAREEPAALIGQLAPGGRLVLPLAAAGGNQILEIIEQHGEGRLTRRDILPVSFVPLIGGKEN
jgi:protein-L-isoaspartate(D-aspartate) O-methyltransferase